MVGCDKGVEVSNGKLEVNNTSYSAASAKCSVSVKAGRWYYEVRLLSGGNMRIGWATERFKGRGEPLGADNEGWGWDGCQGRKYHGSGRTPESYGSGTWSQGDIIGCALDLTAGTISYFHNGEALGVAFHGITPPAAAAAAAGAGFFPTVTLHRRQRVLFNFGADDFCSPQPGFMALHMRVTADEVAELERIFARFASAPGDGGEAAAAAAAPAEQVIEGEGLLRLANDLGQKSDMDPLMLVLVWKLGCKRLWTVSRNEFVGGFATYGVGSLAAAKRKVAEWKERAFEDAQAFGELYNFVFDYLRGEAKTLTAADALMAWQTLELDQRWPLWPKWEAFWKSIERKNISRDSWQQLVPFMTRFRASVDGYDTCDCCWPTL